MKTMTDKFLVEMILVAAMMIAAISATLLGAVGPSVADRRTCPWATHHHHRPRVCYTLTCHHDHQYQDRGRNDPAGPGW